MYKERALVTSLIFNGGTYKMKFGINLYVALRFLTCICSFAKSMPYANIIFCMKFCQHNDVTQRINTSALTYNIGDVV